MSLVPLTTNEKHSIRWIMTPWECNFFIPIYTFINKRFQLLATSKFSAVTYPMPNRKVFTYISIYTLHQCMLTFYGLNQHGYSVRKTATAVPRWRKNETDYCISWRVTITTWLAVTMYRVNYIKGNMPSWY